MTLSHRFHHLGIGLAALVIAGATPAFATHLTTASVIGNSTSYTITVSGADLSATDVYIDLYRIPTTLSCFVGTVCPATPGFWKNQKQHPFPYSTQASGLTIAGVTYSASSLYTILSNNGGNAVAILGRHLVAARLNLAAG